MSAYEQGFNAACSISNATAPQTFRKRRSSAARKRVARCLCVAAICFLAAFASNQAFASVHPSGTSGEAAGDAHTLTVRACGPQGTDALPGAIFEIDGTWDDGFAGGAICTLDVLPSSTTAGFFPSSVLVADESYTLEPVSPAAGYLPTSVLVSYGDAYLSGNALVLELDDAGALRYRSGKKGAITWTQVAGNIVNLRSAATRLSVRTVDADGDDLPAAASYTVEPVGDAGFAMSVARSLDVAGDGSQAVEARLIYDDEGTQNTYRVAQGVAVDGYQVAQPVTVHVDSAGALHVLDQGRDDVAVSADDASVLLVTNAAIVPEPTPAPTTPDPAADAVDPDASADGASSSDAAENIGADRATTVPATYAPASVAGQGAAVQASATPHVASTTARTGDEMPLAVVALVCAAVGGVVVAVREACTRRQM